MTHNWRHTVEAAQADRVVLYQNQIYPRIPYGQEQYYGWQESPYLPCPDCACDPGELHVPTCEVEECPMCQPQQRISCSHWWWWTKPTYTTVPEEHVTAMSQSLFHLTPNDGPHPGPHICADCAAEMAAECDAESPEGMGSTSFCVHNGCDAYTDEEHDAVIDQAGELSDVFYDALNAYSEMHPEMSYDVILHALDCIAYCIKAQMHEDAADA